MRRRTLLASALALASVVAIQPAAVASPASSSAKTGTSGAFAASVIKREPGATWKKMSLKGKRQQKSNWCGPAAATTALTNWTGVSLRKDQQAYFANKMGTNKIGFTSPIAMSRELTKYINAKLRTTGTKYSTYRSIKNDNLWDAVRGFYNYGSGPPILLVSAKKSWYPKAAAGVAHYVVVYGYYDTIVKKERKYLVWDPDYGTRKLDANKWQKIAYTGGIVVAPKQWV